MTIAVALLALAVAFVVRQLGCAGIPAYVDRVRALGNAVVPAVARWIGERILEAIQ